MPQGTILILEDDEDRIQGFRSAVAALDREARVRVWRDAPAMVAECATCLGNACLISLDHDLAAVPGEPDPGTALDVAEFLSRHPPNQPLLRADHGLRHGPHHSPGTTPLGQKDIPCARNNSSVSRMRDARSPKCAFE